MGLSTILHFPFFHRCAIMETIFMKARGAEGKRGKGRKLFPSAPSLLSSSQFENFLLLPFLRNFLWCCSSPTAFSIFGGRPDRSVGTLYFTSWLRDASHPLAGLAPLGPLKRVSKFF